MKKLLFNIIGILSKDPRAVQVSSNTGEDTVSQKKEKKSKDSLFSCPSNSPEDFKLVLL